MKFLLTLIAVTAGALLGLGAIAGVQWLMGMIAEGEISPMVLVALAVVIFAVGGVLTITMD